MSSNRSLEPSALSLNDLPWQVQYNNDRCTLCGQCTAVCPVKAIELAAFQKRIIKTSVAKNAAHTNQYDTFYGIRQKTDVANACIGCAMCTMVCPNDAIRPEKNPGLDRMKFHINQQGVPRRRGGRRNASGSVLDRIKFTRISMLTDPALDAGRHEFEMRTLLGRVLSPRENMKRLREKGWIPPVREIYPLIIGGMSFGALSPHHVGGTSNGSGLSE